MLKLLNVHIEGFCSIVEPQSLPLDIGSTVLIKAPNGFGKTSLFSAITWGLYGKNPKGKVSVNTWKKKQPKDYKGTKVTVTWESDRGVFQVTRCQNYTGKLEDGAKGGDRIILVKDGETLKIKGKVKQQQAINQALGFSYELFVSSILFGQGMKRLIQEDNSDKKKIFEEIFNLEYLTTARTIAQEERSEILSKYHQVESKVNSLEKEIELYQKTYKELKDKEDNYNKLKKANTESRRKQLKKLKKELRKIKAQISSVDYGQEYQDLKSKLSEIQDSIDKAEKVHNVPIFKLVDDTINLLEANKNKKALANLKNIRDSFGKVESLRREQFYTKDEMYDAREKYNNQVNIKRRVKDISQSIIQLKDEIKEIKSTSIREVSPKYQKRIQRAKLDLNSLEESRKSLEVKLDNYNWVLSDPLSNNGIKAFLFDSSLEALNNNLERYADVLGFRIEFSVDLDSARKEFVTLIEKDGIIIEYDELSGGEKGLVNLTMCLALHETLTLSQDVNILLLDEVFENLDRDNVELVISLIRTLSAGKTIFLISHIENLPFGNCKVLEVCKNNGQTHYSHL